MYNVRSSKTFIAYQLLSQLCRGCKYSSEDFTHKFILYSAQTVKVSISRMTNLLDLSRPQGNNAEKEELKSIRSEFSHRGCTSVKGLYVLNIKILDCIVHTHVQYMTIFVS